MKYVALALYALCLFGCGPVRETGAVNGHRHFIVHPECLEAEAAATGWHQPFATNVEQIVDCRSGDVRDAANKRPWTDGQKLAVIMADEKTCAYLITYRNDWSRFTPESMEGWCVK